jgi:hypothetical protein
MFPVLTPRDVKAIVRRLGKTCPAAPLWLTGRSVLNEARRRHQFG